jgi:hypothetical protein
MNYCRQSAMHHKTYDVKRDQLGTNKEKFATFDVFVSQFMLMGIKK